MTDDDPIPLKAGGEAAPELVRALYALGTSGLDVARLARAAERLAIAIEDAGPPGAGGLRKLFGTKTLITGVVIGFAALSWLGYHLGGRRHQPLKPPPPAAVEISRIEVAPIVREPAHARVVELAAPEPAPDPSRTSVRRGRRAISPVVTPPTVVQTAPPELVATMVPAPELASATNAPDAANETHEAPPAKPDPTRVAAAAERSEVDLLFDARKAMPQQPSAALRILDEHAVRFPDGLLGPEREVLRIEALRKLGRTGEATQRMRQFESRYPESIHLRRLQDEASSSL